MEPIDYSQIKASKKVLKLIAELEDKLMLTEDALEDITRAAEIVEITGQREILSTWITQSNEFLKNRIAVILVCNKPNRNLRERKQAIR